MEQTSFPISSQNIAHYRRTLDRNYCLGIYLCSPKGVPHQSSDFLFCRRNVYKYTTVGYGDYSLTEHWRILPIIISFTGIFAVSMSGAALYSMMGALIGKNHQTNKNHSGSRT
ncbi:two pore domain potassium channel family protein [Polynucleobacter necessarius]|uniref:two pore domain potassium channel family protein n=1 Tax=Polynucleobacter necessarius TaxID=576610 RepID=UPI0018D4DC37|nr:two pore domain potassium channel family protein [Polynucleobacter necessarius]